MRDSYRIKQAEKTITEVAASGAGLRIIGHQLVCCRPECLTNQLRTEIESNLDAIMVELLIAKVDQAIRATGVSCADLSYYFGTDWAEHHDNPVKLRGMARAVLTLKSNDEFFDTKH